MFSILAGLTLVLGSVAGAIWCWRCRMRGVSWQWHGGTPMSLQSELALLAFFFFGGLAALLQSPWTALGMIVAWLVAWRSSFADTRKHRDRLARLRTETVNASQFPEVFAKPPPTLTAEGLPDRPGFRVFDNFTCTYLGTITRKQLQFLIHWHEECGLGGLGGDFCKTNDIFLLEDSLDLMAGKGADPALIESLRNWMVKSHEIELRWIAE
jgi:hypothetical protein